MKYQTRPVNFIMAGISLICSLLILLTWLNVMGCAGNGDATEALNYKVSSLMFLIGGDIHELIERGELERKPYDCARDGAIRGLLTGGS